MKVKTFFSYVGAIIFIVLLLVMAIDSITKKCIESENICYKQNTYCSKYGCRHYDTPVSCDDNQVIGNKTMCIKEQSLIFGEQDLIR